MEIPINSRLPATFNTTAPSGTLLLTMQDLKSKFDSKKDILQDMLFTNLTALLTSSIGMSEKSKPTTAEAGVPVLAFSPATTLNQEQETKVPLTKNIFDIQNKKGTETQSASSGLTASETCATPSCTKKINYLYAIEDATMFSPPEMNQFSTQKDRDEILLPLDYGNKSKTQPALPVRHLLGGDVGDLETPDTNPLAHQLHTVTGEIIITEPPPFSNEPFDRLTPLKARLLTGLTVMNPVNPPKADKTGTLAFSTEAGIVTGSAFTGVRNAKPLKAELLEIDLLNTLQNENNKDTQSSSPPVSGNLLFALPENKDTASPVRGSMLYNIIPVNPDNLVTLEASNGTSEANNKLSLLNRMQQEIHNIEPKIAAKNIINQYVVADNDTVEVTAEKVQVEAKAKFSLPLPSPLPLPGEANPQQQVAGQNPSSLSMDSKINTYTQTAEQTQPAFRPTNGGQAGVGYLETPNTNPLTYQALAHVEYKSMSELSTPEITIEEITYPRAANPVPQEGLVSVLEKPIRQQSTSYTNPLSASDDTLLLDEHNTIPLLARQDPAPKGFDLSSAEGLMWKQDTALKTSAWEQALITKRGIIVEPQPLSNFANIQENQPLTNSEKTSYTSNAFLVSVEGSQTSVLKKAEPLEINLSNTIQEVNNLTLERVSRSPERSEGKDAQPSPPPFALPNDKDTASPVRGSMLYNIIPANPDNLVTLEASNGTSEANNKLSMLNRLQQEIHNTEPKIAVKNIISQYVIADNNTVEVTAEKVQVEAKAKFSLPLPSPLPLPGEANPRWHVAGQNLLTLSMDYKISANTQTGTKPEIVQNETSNPPTQPADVEHYVETQDGASLHKEETKTVDLSTAKVNLAPALERSEGIDEQHKNLPTNLSTNEHNASIGASPLEGSLRQSVKDVPKMNNQHQAPESDYNNIIEQIAQKARISLREGRSDIKLRLEPPELGHIKLKFSVTGNRLEASIEVENLNVMRAIEKDVPRLRESISSAGIDVGRLDVLCHEGNDGYHRPYFAQHTDPKTQNSTEEDTNIETVEKVDEGLAITGINNASAIGRIDYIV